MTEQSQHLFRFLITGASQVHLSFAFRVGHSTVGKVLRETSQVLWDCLRPTVLPVPTVAVWEKIALDFCSIWQLPNCVGALDGKHVRIKAPANSGSELFCLLYAMLITVSFWWILEIQAVIVMVEYFRIYGLVKPLLLISFNFLLQKPYR